jgi:hypothetical protein
MRIMFLIFSAIQVAGWVAMVLAMMFEQRDPRFEGARLIYRS